MSSPTGKFYGQLPLDEAGVRTEFDSPYDALMDEVCVGLGFCGSIIDDEPCHVSDLLPEAGTVTDAMFADLVMQAEGMPKAEYPEFWRAIRNAFRRHMGTHAVDRALLKYDIVRDAPDTES